MSRVLTYVQAIQEALDHSMALDEKIFIMGLGATYENGCDGTTAGLVDKYPDRVFDTPCSENATTGFCTGAALLGMRPVIYHGRVEFALFAFDQLVTQAAKWNYMFGGLSPVPAVYRIAVGRRWGDAPQHTSVLHSIFGHIPGLKVVVPSTPRMAKLLLVSAIFDDNPVLFLEHRWLYGISQTIPKTPNRLYACRLSHCEIIKKGEDLTIVAVGEMVIEALKCARLLKHSGIDPEIIDLVSINPIDYETIIKSVKKTGMLMVADVGTKACGIGSEIISRICEENIGDLIAPPVNIATPDCPCPMSPELTKEYYPTAETIIDRAAKMFGKKIAFERCEEFRELHMPPDLNIDSLLKEDK